MSIEGRMPGVASIPNAKCTPIIPGIVVNECPPMPVASGPASEGDESQTMCCARQLTLSGPSRQGRVSASVSRSKRLTVSQVTVLERAFNNDHNPTHAQECLMASHFNVDVRAIKSWYQSRRGDFRRTHSEELRVIGVSEARKQPFPTLDEVACSRELPPPRPRSAFNTSYHPQHTRYIWEHMVSSPPSSPPAVSRDGNSSSTAFSVSSSTSSKGPAFNLSSFSSLRRKPRISMEWACANASSSPRLEGSELTEDDTMTEISEEMDQEAVTPSDGQSLASVPITSTHSQPVAPPHVQLLTKSLERLHEQPRTFSRSQSMGVKNSSTLRVPSKLQIRTVRNFRATPVSGRPSSPLLPVSMPIPKKHATQQRSVSSSSISSTQEEMDAALALCGLLSS